LIKINEIFFSIQGEGEYQGKPCVFVRLTYCNLRCSYCDTEYAFYEGEEMEIEEILRRVKSFGCPLVEVTGGEPLFQPETKYLLKALCNEGFEVLLETGGSLPIKDIDERVKIIMDLKTPSSGMVKKNLFENLKFLKNKDEIKFVIGNFDDYLWSKGVIEREKLTGRKILFSPVFEKLDPATLVSWILRDRLNVKLNLQIQKFIWEPNSRGV